MSVSNFIVFLIEVTRAVKLDMMITHIAKKMAKEGSTFGNSKRVTLEGPFGAAA